MAITNLRVGWWLFLGRNRSNREDYQGALMCYERVLHFFPRHLRALANAGNCLHHLKRYAEAIPLYDRALQERPDYPDVHARLGLIFMYFKRYQESFDSLNRAFRIKPGLKEDFAFLHCYALSLAHLGRTEEALEAYKMAAEIHPRNGDVLAGIGWALLELGRYAEAEISLRDAVELQPENGMPLLHLSFALGGLSKYDESLAIAERFAVLSQKSRCPFKCSLAAKRIGQTTRSAHFLREIGRLNPSFAEGYCELGRIHERLGEYQEAIDAEEKALSLAQDPLAYCVMGLALMEQGNHERSLHFSQKAVKLRPSFFEAWNNLGEAHLAMGQFDQGLCCLETALQLAPASADSAELRWQIGTTQLKLGNVEAAKNQYQLLQDMGSNRAEELHSAILANDSCRQE